MPLINTHQALVPVLHTAASAAEGRAAASAHFVDTEDDPCVDRLLVDPLDDRDRRCAFHSRSN
jgi:hypothetical protein